METLVNWNSGQKEVTCFYDAVFISWLYHDNVVVVILFIFSAGKTIRTAAISEVWVVFVELANKILLPKNDGSVNLNPIVK